ncbi:MAG: hypothetical protein IPH84_10570 [Bacteroidales bacterium]|nr:hypothetical protein [Bacteroidales bacterium]
MNKLSHYLSIVLIIELFTISYPNKLIGQTENRPLIDLPKNIPPSPTPANLGEFGKTPVSLYTGSPSVSIPIYNIEVGNYSFPIVLNYKSGGIKVNEMSSWVGLGWSLMAGGCITRSQNGLADELPGYGYVSTPVDINSLSIFDKLQYFDGNKDSESDEFNFTLPNKSGGFHLTKNNTIKIANGEELLINKTLSPAGISFQDVGGDICIKKPILIIKWEIIDENGIKYIFDKYEKVVSFGRYYKLENNGFVSNFDDIDPDPTQTNPTISTWYLTRIETPENETVDFEYVDEEYTYDIQGESKRYVSYDPNQFPSWLAYNMPQISLTGQRLSYKSKRLSRITTTNSIIEFVSNSERADLIGAKYLNNILIKNTDGEIVKNFNLNYNYLLGNLMIDAQQITPYGTNTFSLPCNYPLSFSYRLMLSEVKEVMGSEIAKSYKLDYYHEIGLPNRASIWKDHWGYSNGPETDPDRLMHPFKFHHLPGYQDKTIVHEKEPDINYTKQGTLKTIIYPTGGYSEFEFELHDCISDLLPNPFNKIPAINFSINYMNYPYLDYESEIMLIDEGNHTAEFMNCYYVEFTVNDLAGFDNIELELSDYPVEFAEIGAIGFFIDRVSGSPGRVWTLNSDLLSFSPPTTWNSEYCSQFSTQVFGGTKSLLLPNGTYRLYHYPVSDPPPSQLFNECAHFYSYSLNIEERHENYYSALKKVGGLRIKKMTDFKDSNSNGYVTSFEYVDDNMISSGQLVNFPSYIKDYYEQHYEQHDCDACLCNFGTVGETTLHFKVHSTETNYPLLSTSGSYIGYSQVIEKRIEFNGLFDHSGKTIFNYTSSLEFPDLNYDDSPSNIIANPYPYPPTRSRDFCRGKLKSKRIMNSSNAVIYKENNTFSLSYEELPNQKTDYKLRPGGNFERAWECLQAGGFFTTCHMGHKVMSIYEWFNSPAITFPIYPLTITDYSSVIGKFQLEQTVTYEYTTQGTINSMSDYQYKGNRVAQVSKSTSTNETINTINLYPDDFSTNSILVDMKNRNMINYVVEQLTKKNNTTNINHIKTTFGYIEPSHQFINKTKVEEKIGDGNFVERLSFNKYTNLHGKLKEYKLNQGPINSIIWSDDELYLLAEIQNTSLMECGFTGFENNELNGWYSTSPIFETTHENVHTGNSSLNITGTTLTRSFNVISAGGTVYDPVPMHSGYKASVWVKGGTDAYLKISIPNHSIESRSNVPADAVNNWYQLEVEIPYGKYDQFTGSGVTMVVEISASSTAYIDDLRFHPMDAQMKSYTYKPLFGVTSISDQNNKPTYYEYDPFGRLNLVKDENLNILKKTDYHYRPQ